MFAYLETAAAFGYMPMPSAQLGSNFDQIIGTLVRLVERAAKGGALFACGGLDWGVAARGRGGARARADGARQVGAPRDGTGATFVRSAALL